MNKILTIITPAYNMEKYLRRCLDSMLIEDKELFNRLEVLIVNDGSKDSTSVIAHNYQDKYPQTFVVIDKENGNYGSCINVGLKVAQDDTFDTENFKEFLAYLAMADEDCVLSDMVQVDEDGNKLKYCGFDLPSDRVFSIRDLGRANVSSLWMHCVCYRTENLRRIGYFQTEGISYTDQEWICLPMSASKSISYFPRVIYYYLVGREGQTMNVNVWEKNFWMEVKGLRVMMDELLNSSGTDFEEAYVKERIRIRTTTVYTAFFLRFRSSKDNELMKELDLFLEGFDKDLYGKVGEIVPSVFLPYKVVRHWRENARNDCVAVRATRRAWRAIVRVKHPFKKF